MKIPIFFPETLTFLNGLSFLEQYYYLKRELEERCHVYRFWKKTYIFWKTTSISPKNPKIWLFWDFLSNLKTSHAFQIKNVKQSAPGSFQGFSRRKNIIFQEKFEDLNVLRLHKREQFLKRLLNESIHVEWFCKVARIFRIKTFSFSEKTKNLNVSRTHEQ